jgi:hypothetical protein
MIWQVIFPENPDPLESVRRGCSLVEGILKESLSRWTIHSFIYLPFFLRFFIGLILLIVSKCFPMSPSVVMFLDKIIPIAFTYDLLGLCVIIGVAGATMRRFQKHSEPPLEVKI